jgi:hypothetical protein
MTYTEHPKCCMAHHFQDKNSCTCRCHYGLTHEELLKKILKTGVLGKELGKNEWIYNNKTNALCAVVELHKPDKEGLCAMNCVEVDDDGYAWTQVAYPCPTIQAITKELQ